MENASSDSSSPTMSGPRVQLQQQRSLSSHHLIASADPLVESGGSQLIVVKPEVNCGGSVMSVSPMHSTFTYGDGQCPTSMGQNVEDMAVKSDLSADSQNNLFGCGWVGGNRSSSELEMVTVKPEPSVDDGGQLRHYENFVPQSLELAGFVGARDQYGHSRSFETQNCTNDVCLGSASSDQQNTDDRLNNVEMMASDVSMDSVKHQQLLVDESLGDFGFNASHSPLMSSQSMPLLPTYTASELLKGPPAAGYQMSGMFPDKSDLFVDPSFNYSGSAHPGYSGMVQPDILANEPESGYGRCFGYSDHGSHEGMQFQNSDQQRTNQPDVYFSSVPRTPTLYAAVGPKQVSQQPSHRTPRTPYTPGTPSRPTHFQFPSITEGAVVGNCQHRYQKSTVYHPYGHQHTPTQAQQLTTLGPASPHYLHQRHVASVAHEMNQQQFRHDVAHAQQEIEQRLQQLQHEDKLKQMLMTQQTNTDAYTSVDSIHCQPASATNGSGMSTDVSVVHAPASHNSHDGQNISPVDEVLQVIMRDAPEMSTDAGSIDSRVPLSSTLQLKSENSREGCTTAMYPHSASDSLLSQFSGLAYEQTELKKLRRKHKPEPLVIPPDVSNFGAGNLAMQWSYAGPERFKFQFHPGTSEAVMSPRMAAGGGTQWVQRPQQMNHYGEPRSAPPFHWSSAVMCKSLITYFWFVFLLSVILSKYTRCVYLLG